MVHTTPLNSIFYVVKTGIQWRMLPSDLPPWQTVYWYFTKWSKDGSLTLAYNKLYETIRKKTGKEATPSVGIIDSQSVKSSITRGIAAYDGGKKINGIKRHILVDTLGLIIGRVVHKASIQDRDGAKFVFNRVASNKCHFPKLAKMFADGGYTGKFLDWFENEYNDIGWSIEVVKRTDKGFKILPKRWIVERTFAWLYQQRRLSMNYERKTWACEAVMDWAMLKIIINRLS